MEYSIEVENIRCGGCSNTITKKMSEIKGVKEVHVNVEDKHVQILTESDADSDLRQVLVEKLTKLGYPEKGSIGSNGLITKATSVVSCAIGKVSNK